MDCRLLGSLSTGYSSGKNNGVGCHALLQGIFSTQGSNPGFLQRRQILYHLSYQVNLMSNQFSRSVVSDSLQPHESQPARLCPWDSPGKNTGVGCHALLQGIFSTQGSNPSLPHCRQILYHLSHQGSPGILEWVACPFVRGSSRLWNRIRVSSFAGGFFTS